KDYTNLRGKTMKSTKLILAITILLAMVTVIPVGAQDPITISLWTWTANKLEVYEGWIADYTAEFAPNVTIEINLIPRANYDQTLAAALIGGQVPDIWEALPLGEVKDFY